jgi:hypothetical protein
MHAKLDRVVTFVLIASGLLVLASYLGLAIVHLSTLYDINQTSGAWLSFAYYLDHGVLYPPPYMHGFYAGTRYMPLFFAIHAAIAHWTGEYLASGKLATLASMIGIVVALYAIISARIRSPLLALALAAVPLATFVGHKGSLTIRSDVLPLAISLFALYLVDDKARPEAAPLSWRRLVGSAILAGVAPLAKFTSFHALTAGFADLFFKDKKRAFAYAGVGFGTFVLGLFAVESLSGGRFFENFSTVAVGPGRNTKNLAFALSQYAWYVRSDRGFLIILVLAFVALARMRKAKVDLYKIYFLLQLVISIGFFFDVGAEYNHLIDLCAASVIVLVDNLLPTAPAALRVFTLAALGFVSIFGFFVHHLPAWTAPERTIDPRQWLERDLGLRDQTFLTQDPTVAVVLNQRPIVADDFQYRVLVDKGVIPSDELPSRIRAHEFDRIVLLNPPDNDDPEDPDCSARELGSQPAHDIRAGYALEKHVGKYYVYRPKELTP